MQLLDKLKYMERELVATKGWESALHEQLLRVDLVIRDPKRIHGG
jgi:hypothetical protein